ncbi:MAG: response regulator [Anaerolineae bacterium]|nr:response regulator [Anaerolineae bacterium]
MTASRALVVSADRELVEQVEMALQVGEDQVFVARDQLEAILFLDREPCDVVLLEVTRPGPEGFAFCGVIRRSWGVAVALLLRRAAQKDVVLGYQMGADMHVNLPFDPRELRVRVQALARRVQLARERRAAAGEVGPAMPPALGTAGGNQT